MKKILITGGCGFIGVNLVSYLLQKQVAEIKVFDNQSLGKFDYLTGLDVEFIDGDIRDRSAVKKAMIGVDNVIHLAAHTRVVDSITKPEINFQTNVIGTFNVLSAARDCDVEFFVNASTGGAILGEVQPPVHEDMVPHPISPYGASKLAAEGYCSAFSGSYSMNVVSVRFTNVYGPKSYHKGSVVAHFFKQILAGNDLVVYGNGSQLRDYIYVNDLCEGIYNCLNVNFNGEIFQLGTGVPTSVNELIDKIRTVVKSDYQFSVRYENFRKGELKDTYADINKASKKLGFCPKTTLADGLRNTWQWFVSSKH